MTYPSPPSLQASRHRERQSADPAVIAGILDAGMVAHVGFIRDGWPVVLPFHYGVTDLGDGRGPQMIIHGSSGGRSFLDAAAAEAGLPVSVCVSLNDGLVVGRSLYNIGARYRSVIAYGLAAPVPPAFRDAALYALCDHILPGRRDEVRSWTSKEQASTGLIAIPLAHAAAKIADAATGETPDDGEDRTLWAGVIPLSLRAGPPIPSPETTTGIPPSVAEFVARW